MHPDPSGEPAPVAVVLPAAAETGLTPAVFTPSSPRTIRLIELGLLLAVAFGSSLYTAVATLLGENFAGTHGSSMRWAYSLTHELTALGLCAYLLHKQGRTFRGLGLTFRWSDPFLAVGIAFLGLLATMTVTYSLYFGGHFSAADRAAQARSVAHVLSAGLGWGMVVFTVVNGFFEELIVRAYLMTDVIFLTRRTALAVIVSALFQGFYHLYQGWQAAVSVTVGFFVFSVFYARTRRITPIVLAHVLWDLYLLVGYSRSSH